jgi:cytochrome d ubiquinol oxidase subunit I
MSPESTAVILSRIQFGFTVSFHIIFPAFTIGLGAWLAVLEGMHLRTQQPVYRRLFDFWLRIFAVAFGLGVVSGIVMAFQFGSNWSELSRRSGPIQGPLLAYESFTAFALEASFFGVLIFGRSRIPPILYFLSAALVAIGTSLSSFWILVNNSWMQVPTGFERTADGAFNPTSWSDIIFNRVVWVRFPHMILAAYVTTAFCIAATGAWHLLRNEYKAEARVMLRMGLFLAAVLVPFQIVFGHLTGRATGQRSTARVAG